jgi:PAS domain-containing protein
VQEKATVPFLGRSISELSPLLRMVYRDVLDRACASGQPLYTIHAAQASRDVIKWGRLILPIRGAGGGQYVLIIFSPHDLRKSLYDLAMETMSEGIIGLDPEYGNDGNMVDARIIVENKASCDLFGVAQGALINTSLRKTMDAALGFEAFLTLADAVDARRNIEFTSLNPYGVPYVLRVGLGQIGIVLTVRQAPFAAIQSTARKGAA